MIRAQNVSKYFGAKRALGPVSFEIEAGETVGFLGLNGAGKTTALRIFACDLRPSSGSVQIGTIDAVKSPHDVRKLVGFLPETPPLYGDMLVREYLEFSGRVRGMTAEAVKKRLPAVIDLTHLEQVQTQVISTLSHGFRQRVGVAQAIVHDPKLLILDEPTRGLDPVQIVEMRSMIRNLKKNHTVLISSHILTEISQTCDRLMVLDRGRVLGIGSEHDLAGKESEIRSVSVTVRSPGGDDPKNQIAKVLGAVAGVKDVGEPFEQGGGVTYTLETTSDCRADVSRAVVAAKLDLIKLDYSRSALENTFINLVGGSDGSN